MRSRDEGIETVFASYANMTEEKKQKFTQVTAAITSGLPPMSACFNDRLDGANQLAVAKWTVSMSYLVHEIIKELLLEKDPGKKIEESDYQQILAGKDDLYRSYLSPIFWTTARSQKTRSGAHRSFWYRDITSSERSIRLINTPGTWTRRCLINKTAIKSASEPCRLGGVPA